MLTDKYSDDIKIKTDLLNSLNIETEQDVKEFIETYMKLVYDYKMVGLLYDYYTEDIEYQKENRVMIKGIDALVMDTLELLSAFPDLKVEVDNLIVNKTEEGFKIWRRMTYRGTNTNHTKYGEPTGKSLGDGCMGLSMIFMKKVGNELKIYKEINTISSDWIKDTCTK